MEQLNLFKEKQNSHKPHWFFTGKPSDPKWKPNGWFLLLWDTIRMLKNPFFQSAELKIYMPMFQKNFPTNKDVYSSIRHYLQKLFSDGYLKLYKLSPAKRKLIELKDLFEVCEDEQHIHLVLKKTKTEEQIMLPVPVATVDEPVSLPFELYHKPRQTVAEEQIDPELISYMNIQVDYSDPDYLLKLLKSFTE